MIKKSLHIVLLLICPYLTWAQSNRLTENISRSFLVEEQTTIEITNKYGEVIVNTWDKDSVVINVEVTVYGKSNNYKTLNRVDIDFDHFGEFLTVETVLDRNSTFFKEMWNNVSDYSNNKLSKSKISIDYDVTIPTNASFNLVNKFGNVFISNHTGILNLELSHGDLKANELDGPTKIDLSFGKGNLKKMNKGNFQLRSYDLDIRKGGDISLESASSEVSIDEVSSLRLNSRNDKIHVREVRMLNGRASFSTVAVDSMIDQVNMALNFGQFDITSINSNFNVVDVQGKSADVNLYFDIGAFIDLSIQGNEQQIYLSKNLRGLDKKYSQENSKQIILTGDVGIYKGKKSTVNVNTQDGDIYIFLEEGGVVTNK